MTRHRACIYPSGLGCAFGLFAVLVWLVIYAVIAAAWVTWAALVLPAAGIAWLLGRDDAARALAELVMWDPSWLRQ